MKFSNDVEEYEIEATKNLMGQNTHFFLQW